MNIQEFDFELPSHLIAQYPLKERTQSRLLKLKRESQEITHHNFNQLSEHLNKNDLLILNDSKTMLARLIVQKETGGQVEILVEKIDNEYLASGIVGANRKPKLNGYLFTKKGHRLKLVAIKDSRYFFSCEMPVNDILQREGEIPLPRYIKRKPEEEDYHRYQTIYAKNLGSVASPTAGLHFSQLLLDELVKKNVNIGYLTLHIGIGTFSKIKSKDILNHQMHKESIEIDERLCQQIKQCHRNGGKVIAVGTTVTRSLESMMREKGEIAPFSGESDLFLHPGCEFKLIDGMITNFHLPKSTLYILVSAFAGMNLIKKSYQSAIANSYRFFSYGDAMMII